MIFLGTGAAELFPNPFCSCNTCKRARENADPRDIRRRSAVLLDEQNLVDCGPDMLHACNQFHCDLTKISNIFMTHLHSDHFSYESLEAIRRARNTAPHIRIFMASHTLDCLNRFRNDIEGLGYLTASKNFAALDTCCDLVPLEPYQTQVLTDMEVTLTLARHAGLFDTEQGSGYLFSKNGTTTFFSNDTGLLPEETIAYLKTKRIDTLIIDGTFGAMQADASCRHMTIEHLFETFRMLDAQETLAPSSRIIVTHIAHKGELLHAEYEAILKAEYGDRICLAYDGMTL